MSQLEFKYINNFIYFLIPIVSLVLLILAYNKKEKIMNFLKINKTTRFKITRVILITIGLSLITFSLLAPQNFKGYEDVEKKGMDMYILIDTSKSMLVEDIQPNRINRAKKIIENILDNLEGDRVGFIPFSSDAYIQMPLTDDYHMARMFLDVMDTDMISGGGTDIGVAVKLAEDSFNRTSSSDKVIVVLSDGEEHDKNSLNIFKNINSENLKIYTIGIGSLKGGLIPVYNQKEKEIQSYKKDAEGNFVTSQLQPDVLQEIASKGNGKYYQSTINGDEINALLKEISLLKRDTLQTKRIKKFTQLYQYFLGIGMLLFIIAFLLPERSKVG